MRACVHIAESDGQSLTNLEYTVDDMVSRGLLHVDTSTPNLLREAAAHVRDVARAGFFSGCCTEFEAQLFGEPVTIRYVVNSNAPRQF